MGGAGVTDVLPTAPRWSNGFRKFRRHIFLYFDVQNESGHLPFSSWHSAHLSVQRVQSNELKNNRSAAPKYVSLLVPHPVQKVERNHDNNEAGTAHA